MRLQYSKLQMACASLCALLHKLVVTALCSAQDAALIRDQIRDIEEANKPQPPDMQGLTTSSDTVTQGIRVKVRRCATQLCASFGTSTAWAM